MNKTFTWTRPDEPNKADATGSRTIDITYTGFRYLLVELDPKLGTGAAIRMSDDINDPMLDASSMTHNQWEYVVVDAEQHPALACALTQEYTHEDPNDWSETLTDADGNTFTWEHSYNETTGVIDEETDGLHGGYKYNFVTQQWTGPTYQIHSLSQDEWLEGMQSQIVALQAALDRGTLTEDQTQEVTAYKAWLEDAPRLYDGIDHWKIPFDLPWPTCV